MYFDPVGSIEQRKYRLNQLRSLSPTTRNIDLQKLDRAAFEAIEKVALQEARSNARNSGRLFPTQYRDDAGRKVTEYEGDIMAAFAPFQGTGMTIKINKDVGTREETVKVKSGQKVQVVNI